jgi:bifunctional non-homologous end joining protein LigD
VARKVQGPLTQARRIQIPGAKGAKHPGFVKPQLATLRATAPTDEKFVHEIKFDGYRIQPHLRGGLATIYTRSGLNWTKRFPTVAQAMGHLPATEIILDGEVISPEPSGRANFSQLQDDLSQSRYDRMVFYAFDLLYLDGFDLRASPLIERKKALFEFLSAAKNIAPIHYSEHFETDGASLLKQACEHGLEGIISKSKLAPYRSERNESWLKIKCSQTARYEVIGYKNGATSLYLAKRDGNDLVYVGKAGTGFTQSMIIQLHKLMKPITLPKMPLAKKPDRKNKIDNWAAPKYWAEVEYRDITTDGLLRHTTFKGLYDSKKSKKPLVAKFK